MRIRIFTWKRVALLLFFLIALPAGFLYFSLRGPVQVPSFAQVKAQYQSSDAVLLDRHGDVLQKLRVDLIGRKLHWVELDQISSVLLNAVVISEDKRFYSHKGVDWRALAGAALENIFSRKKRGASTITMQLAGILNKDLKGKGSKKNIALKMRQMRTALELEKTWKKDEILEAYLNLISFRGELQGISAASRGLFDKEPSGLNSSESLVLAALIRSPNAQVEEVERRAFSLGFLLAADITREEINSIVSESLRLPYHTTRSDPGLAFHLAGKLLSNGKKRIISTLDGPLQRFASETLEKYISDIEGQNASDGAVLVIHNRTGQVLAYVANRGRKSPAPYVDGVMAKRQAGSTLKPFLYASAFEKKLLTPASMLDDSPLDIATARGVYNPSNYDRSYKGSISARAALASSLNVPAVRVAVLVGPQAFVAKLKELGFRDLEDGDFYGPSIALGSADVSLWELANAYRTLANKGRLSEPVLVFSAKGKASKRVFSEEAAFLSADILSDREARSLAFGLENPLSTKYWSAAKTGTSKDMRDNWCAGFSSEYTVAVWVGNFNGTPMWNVSGISGAAPIWLEIMYYLHRAKRSLPPSPTENLSRVAVNSGAGQIRQEWFIKGTEPVPNRAELLAMDGNKILYPPDGLIIAVDPDIPAENQKVFFESKEVHGEQEWLLNGNHLCTGELCGWTPISGSYELSLVRDNLVLDRVYFQVK